MKTVGGGVQISLKELKEMAENMFGGLVKAVVDIEKELMVVGGDLHADEEAELLKQGSSQQNLWGVNLYPEERVDNWVEFDSMINVRPSQGNFSREVGDEKTRERILEVINKLVER